MCALDPDYRCSAKACRLQAPGDLRLRATLLAPFVLTYLDPGVVLAASKVLLDAAQAIVAAMTTLHS